MSTSPNSGDDKNVPPDSSTAILLLLTIADTTWRLFIPSVGLTIGGLLLDRQLHTIPWFTVAGVIVGGTIAVLLVRLQMKRIENK